MDSIASLVNQWAQLKQNDPKGWGKTYNDTLFFLLEEHKLLSQLAAAGCVHIPGETLPILEMLAERAQLITRSEGWPPLQKSPPHWLMA